MSEFEKTMRDWRRLCDFMTKKYDCHSCVNCPLYGFACSGVFEMPENTDWRLLREKVDAWAAENPEPQYPTWAEWLKEQDIIAVDARPRASSTTSGSSTYIQNVSTKPAFYRPIPSDIAEKLGLKPKGEENGA